MLEAQYTLYNINGGILSMHVLVFVSICISFILKQFFFNCNDYAVYLLIVVPNYL